MKTSFLSSFFFTLALALTHIAPANGQTSTCTLSGKVKNTAGKAIPFANIHLENTHFGTVADYEGDFMLEAIPQGTYIIRTSSVGYKSHNYTITLLTDTTLIFSLEESINHLAEVQVSERAIKSTSEKVEESGFSVNSIDTHLFENLSADINHVLGQSTGIRIKESGGLGSKYNLSLNGLSDKQVRIFVDEIPVDQLGSSFNLNNIPVNLVERIDVYKGVVPIKLGGDALGGSINIVTKEDINSYLDASYTISSFNTHRAALNSLYRGEKGFTVKTSGFYNYSDNNYRMENMPVFVEGKELEVDIRRFHDQYKSQMGKIEVGFTRTKWADQLLASISLASVDQDIQSGVYGKPVGEATESEKNQTYTLRYGKKQLLNDKLNIDLFLLYNTVNSTSIDTSSNRYDWSGNIIRTENNSLGELVREKTIFEYEQSHFLYRANLTYRLDERQALRLNQIASQISRQGENRLNIKANEPFRSPNDIQQKVSGLEYQLNLLDERWGNTAAVKYYDLHLLTRNAIQYQQGDFEIQDILTNQKNWGYSIASRFSIQQDWYVKASIEKGYRLPQPREIFGDGLRIMANPDLKPESSLNINLGMNYRIKVNRNIFRTGINLFMRDVNNFIFIQQEGVFSRYKNVLNVLVKGLEWEFSYQLAKKLDIQTNLTWQNVMNNERYIAGTSTPSQVYRDRMPNTPYLFANFHTTYSIPKPIMSGKLAIYYASNFVNKFYLNYPSVSVSETKNSIPTQFLHHIGITFTDINKQFNVSLEARNLFDQAAYDNFKLQKPGRSFHLKLRYFISKNNSNNVLSIN